MLIMENTVKLEGEGVVSENFRACNFGNILGSLFVAVKINFASW